MTKKCSKCLGEFDVSSFSKKSSSPDGLRTYCKSCGSAYSKKYADTHRNWQKDYSKRYRQKNLDKLKQYSRDYAKEHENELKEYTKQWRTDNAKKLKESQKEYYDNNRDKILMRLKDPNVKERIRKYDRQRRKKPSVKISQNISRALRISLNKHKNGHHWELIVGYSLDELMKHLEKQFKEGMSWDNYGEWEIDHIIPQCSFSFDNIHSEEFLKCWSLTNLQPLWKKDNRQKSGKTL